ncbi:MAG: sulfatase-like hydrolase/transferase, partial [Verrucomicrobiota bacterium]
MKPLFSLLLVFLLSSAAFAEAPRPNILYFYVDDWGWGAIGPNGQAERKEKGLPYVLTPNLDKLAAEGVNFTRSYGCMVCSPARSSQQTGFHQGHTFADRNNPDNAKKAIRKDDLTMGDVLLGADYTTGYWGKWGYGGSKSQPDPVIENVQTLPTSHGYQYVVAELHHVRAHTFFQPTLWSAPAKVSMKSGGLTLRPNSMDHWKGKDAYPNKPAFQNHADYPKVAYCDDVYAFAALDFVRNQAQSGEPFFALFAAQIPHAPFDEIQQLPNWDQDYADLDFFDSLSKQTQEWAAMVTRLDAHFGNILDALEDPNGDGDKSDSVRDNTLVIFQSDNGGPQHAARKEFRANGGLRGNKGDIYEGGIRIPTIMRWPRKLEAGTTNDRVVDVTDLLPTFCDLAGAETPLGLDGVSIAPTLTGEGEQRTRDFVIHEAKQGASIIRGRHKLIHSKKTGSTLYDLVDDHAEETDIAAKHPEMVEELKTLLLGERVEEPQDFANTYHHWTGEDGASLSDAANWSDYIYENAGIAYMTDDGAPQLSWTASIQNDASAAAVAKVDNDVEFLALDVRGKQEVVVEKGATLTARNELRIWPESTLTNNGAVSTLRWIDVHEGAVLQGDGKVEGKVYNRGKLELSGSLRIQGSLHQFERSEFQLNLADAPQLQVSGAANLDGHLVLEPADDLQAKRGDEFVILVATRIEGRFANPSDVIVASNGMRFAI